MKPVLLGRLGAAAAAGALFAWAPPANAEPGDADEEPPPLSGVVREATIPGRTWEDFGSAALFVPRETLGLLFLGTSMAAAVLQDESTVPRFANVSGGEARLYVFPTAFVETERIVSLGARMIGASDHVATSLRAGIGGPEDTVLESRVFLRLPLAIPTVVGAETFFSRASGLPYTGVGQVPAKDARNRFVLGRRGRSGAYDESRQRAILSAGLRPVDDVELLASVSMDRRDLDATTNGSPSIDDVFTPGSVPGSEGPVRLWYGETALRLDTRPARGGPQEGISLEAYGGLSRELPNAPPVSLARVGGAAAAFVKVLRRSNLIIPRMSLGGLVGLGDTPVPFTELPRQPAFRGAGDRQDFVSWLGSVDYRWGFASAVGARLFVDTTTVGPSVQELAFSDLRWAVGAGLDIWSTGSDIGSLAIAGGPDGVSLQVSFGVASGFGDRQHRD